MSSTQWDPDFYTEKHSYVFEYGRDVVELLNPQPGERILDLGCGNGHLTRMIAASGAHVVGIDSSPEMLRAARREYPEVEFILADARDFSFPDAFDAVFSNAALHWVLEAESAVRSISRALRPGGRFIAEFGGKGNVASITGALKTVLREVAGVNEENWSFFPSIGEYAALLERHGLEVTFAILFDRPTRLGEDRQGLRNWVAMFRGKALHGLTAEVKERVLAELESRLRGKLFRDGCWYADYRRLRIVAYKE
jgi:trans-aconitate methyltransferase